MSTTFIGTQNLTTEVCCNCGMLFAMPEEYRSRRLQDHAEFYCPAGHGQHFTPESEAEKLRRQLAQAQTMIERKEARENDLLRQRETLRYQCRGLKGSVTRIKNRVQHGVCPCCNRTFQNLASHMETKHPDYAKDA